MQKPKHFVARRDKRGWRYYWQPTPALKRAGWQSRRLDGGKNRAPVAMRQAAAINRQVDAWRAGHGSIHKSAAVADLVADYLAAPAFGRLAGSTRRQYRGCLDRIVADLGADQVLAVTPDRVAQVYRAWFDAAPAAAAQRVAVLRLLFAHAVGLGWLEFNPAAGLRVAGVAPRHRLWSDEDFSHLVATADAAGWSAVGTVAMIAFFVGLRETDILELTRFNYAHGIFRVRCQKTGRLVQVPHVPRLARRLADTVAGDGPLIVNPRTGLGWNPNTFRHVFLDVMALAMEDRPAMAGLQFRDFRRTAQINLYRAGATVPELATITGHSIVSTQRIIDWYFVRHPDLAKSAMVKLSEWRIAQ